MKKLTLFKILIPLSILVLFSAFFAKTKEKSPNIILIFMDDLGYGDLSAYGALDYRTPNIDRMGTERAVHHALERHCA
jgi:hypothetical protein